MKYLILILLLSATVFSQTEVQRDTLKTGKSTFTYTFSNAYSVKLTFKQLDTNATLGDTVYATTTVKGLESDSLGFNESKSDSLFTRVVLRNLQKRTGWIWLPGINQIKLYITNASLTGRSVEFTLEPFYIP